MSFTLKKPLLNNLDNNQGEIRENLKYISFLHPVLFNGLWMEQALLSKVYDKKEIFARQVPKAVIFQEGVLENNRLFNVVVVDEATKWKEFKADNFPEIFNPT